MTDLALLHGVGLDRHMWDRCTPLLAQQHRVRTLDLLGHGESSPAPRHVTLDDLTATVAAQLERPTHLVGFSLGALVAQRLAITHPDLVRSLVLVSSVAHRSHRQRVAVLERLASAERDFASAARDAVDRWMSAQWQTSDPQLAKELYNTLLSNDHLSYLACYQVFATADRQLWLQLSQIEAHTLVLTGSDDTGSTPEMAHRLAEAIPRARAAIVAGARHLVPLEIPRQLAENILEHTTEVDHAARAS